ncbi:MAG: hypothetical protein JEZ07_02060 [Phycisphaerae bacterium]|nr:hypothetical protein [Phycisphaerae bacterium]
MKIKLLLILLLLSSTTWACQYNVRDIGFVDLKGSTYKLYVFLDKDNSEQQSQLQTLLNDKLYDSNVISEILLSDSNVFHIEKPTRLPAAVLVASNSEKLSIALDKPNKTISQQLTDITDQLISSSIKSEILKQMAGNFAVVLLIESADSKQNIQAQATIANSLEYIKQQMVFMPKKVNSPPVLFKISAADAKTHDIFLWELGINKIDGTAAAIVYGRLRKMGPVMTGNEITEEMLNAYLGVIGADCECDLDRRLLHSPMLAHRWPRQLYLDTTEALGFDPENPQVKMEISQIISSHSSISTGKLETPDVSFGYQEFIIDDSSLIKDIDQLPEVAPPENLEEIPLPPVNQEPAQKRTEPKPKPITPDGGFSLSILVILAIIVVIAGFIIVMGKK